jgi:hypothetical protein
MNRTCCDAKCHLFFPMLQQNYQKGSGATVAPSVEAENVSVSFTEVYNL